MFYFAWADKDEAFGPSHHVQDEDVFGLSIQHNEGDFPAMELDLRNPRVGLLTSSRQQWAWLSYRKPDTTVVPLFFGRLVGVPQDLQNEVVRLLFVARPSDYEDQLETLAESLKVAPYWDEVWFSEEERADPDRVLEGRSALWHIDRVTHTVTISNITAGEDTALNFTSGTEAFYDSVSVAYSTSPARRCIVSAEVNWTQAGRGSVDITQPLLAAFAASTPEDVQYIGDMPAVTEGVINVIPGEALVQSWPKFGASVGGGWSVGYSNAQVIGDSPTPPILIGNVAAYTWVKRLALFPGDSWAIHELFSRAPGVLVSVEDQTEPWLDRFAPLAHGAVNFMWLPVWQVSAQMNLNWDASRARKETVEFTVDADVQPLLTDADEEETIRLSVGPADVDPYIGDVRRSRYFATDRGRQSMEHLLARARANLLARARAIDVTFSVPFEAGLGLSCRKSASLVDARLPGGVAAGKIKGYTLTAEGDSGTLLATLTMGCTIGRDGAVSVVPGTPVYCEDAYVAPDYQEHVDSVVVPFAGDLGYTMPPNYTIADDGVNLFSVYRDFITGITVQGGLAEQEAAVKADVHRSTAGAVDRVNDFETKVTVTMRPVTGGPFESIVQPDVTDLKIPRTIDLEEVA